MNDYKLTITATGVPTDALTSRDNMVIGDYVIDANQLCFIMSNLDILEKALKIRQGIMQ